MSELVWNLLRPVNEPLCVHIRLQGSLFRAVRVYLVDEFVVGARALETDRWSFASTGRTVLNWVKLGLVHGTEIGLRDETCAQSVRLPNPIKRVDLLAAAAMLTGEPDKLETAFASGAAVVMSPATQGLSGDLGRLASAASGGATLGDLRVAVGEDVSEEFLWAWIYLLTFRGLELGLVGADTPSAADAFWDAASSDSEAFEKDQMREGGAAWSHKS